MLMHLPRIGTHHMTDASGTSVTDKQAKGPSFMQIPLAISRNRNISPSAKLAYGRLVLYAGKDGSCHPSHDTIGAEVGIRDRQVRNVLAELKACGLIEWSRTRSSNAFIVRDENCPEYTEWQLNAGQIGTILPDRSAIKCRQKDVVKTGLGKDVRDIDCPPTKRKPRVSSADVCTLPPSTPKAFPRLSRTVASYMADNPHKPQPEDFPNPSKVVEIMDASGGESEAAVVDCLAHLYNNRGLRPGTTNGPRSFAWFPVVVHEYFTKRADREGAVPCGYSEWEDRNAVKEENAMLKQAEAFDYSSRKRSA